MTSGDEIKRSEKAGYDSVAEAFDGGLARYSARFAADLIDLLFPQKLDSAIDVAGGTGAAGLRLAERIGPEGSVTIVDISEGVLQIAARNADRRRLPNIRTAAMDAENLDFPDSSFDILTCCFGIMFFPDPAEAVREAFRVLKPGGRAGFVVWSIPERFPMFAVPMSAVLDRMAPLPLRLAFALPLAGPPLRRRILTGRTPAGFSPCRFSRPGSLESLLSRSGFSRIRRELRAFPLEFAGPDEYWRDVFDATPAGQSANNLPPAVLNHVKREVRRALVDPRTGRILMFNEAALVLATKPA
jgi:ubiquinone/menaquinone biosynthesis C-methylase UbiE